MTHDGNDGNDGNERDDGDPIEGLRSELKRVPLSPEFAARLRQRIDEVPAAHGAAWLAGWRWWVPVAAVAAVVVAVVSVAQRRSDAPGPAATTLAAAVPTVPVVPDRSRSFPVAPPPSPAGLRRGFAVVPAEPALEVLTDQPALYRALLARAGKGPVAVEVTPTILPDAVPDITVPSIDVSPIAIKWLGDPRLAPGVLSIAR